jgi:hypothetical protein
MPARKLSGKRLQKALALRPTAEPWRLWRSVAARLLWHYYREVRDGMKQDETEVNAVEVKNPLIDGTVVFQLVSGYATQ